MSDDNSSPAAPETDNINPTQQSVDESLDPSGIAQFIEHDRCPRYLKQRVDPGNESNARDWREAFGLMNIALLGKGQEFEVNQIETLAADAEQIIAPELDHQTATPDIPADGTWADSPRARAAQLITAIEQAAALNTFSDDVPYILLYQVPLGGTLGEEHVYGDADCIALAPADAVSTPDDTVPAVVARVIDCKSTTVDILHLPEGRGIPDMGNPACYRRGLSPTPRASSVRVSHSARGGPWHCQGCSHPVASHRAPISKERSLPTGQSDWRYSLLR